jgi:hypothetical protein
MHPTQPRPNSPSPPIDPGKAMIGVMMADGTITLVLCEVCPFRGDLCNVCVVPEIRAEMESDGMLEITDERE